MANRPAARRKRTPSPTRTPPDTLPKPTPPRTVPTPDRARLNDIGVTTTAAHPATQVPAGPALRQIAVGAPPQPAARVGGGTTSHVAHTAASTGWQLARPHPRSMDAHGEGQKEEVLESVPTVLGLHGVAPAPRPHGRHVDVLAPRRVYLPATPRSIFREAPNLSMIMPAEGTSDCRFRNS